MWVSDNLVSVRSILCADLYSLYLYKIDTGKLPIPPIQPIQF